ncbi:hypothetical protein [Megalodesulfovibrio paquesii]
MSPWESALAEPLQDNAYIHFFVVPTQGTQSAKALEAMREHLVALAGGFTELGTAPGGERQPDGQEGRQVNAAFLVAAPENLSRQIEAYVATHFKEERPFVLVWQGQCSLYRN